MQLAFPDLAQAPTAAALAVPAAYRGLYAFHKYWGKKPAEPMRYLIRHLCPEGGLVVDPFLGSGISALEAVQLHRRFVGIDINPAAVRLTRMLVSPPSACAVQEAFARISELVKEVILESYTTVQKRPATHFIWRKSVMEMVWRTDGESRNRLELPPDEHDIARAESFAAYQPQRLRAPRFFTNSRINSSASLTLKDLFTGRALRNIELLLTAIDDLPPAIQEPMRLSLTAAVGQMSKMVFAITGRGKTTGVSSDRIEVGSWVIGYWRPEQHFEVNVWSCFERRVQKLVKAIAESVVGSFEMKIQQKISISACRALLSAVGLCIFLTDKLQKVGRGDSSLLRVFLRMRAVLWTVTANPPTKWTRRLRLAMFLDPVSILQRHQSRWHKSSNLRQRLAEWIVSHSNWPEPECPDPGEIAQVSLELQKLRQRFASKTRQESLFPLSSISQDGCSNSGNG